MSLAAVFLILTSTVSGTDRHVPSEYSTIQAAINACNNEDAVIVADGNYTGADNKNIDFGGLAITLRSENGPDRCIIDCENSGRGFYFHSGEDANDFHLKSQAGRWDPDSQNWVQDAVTSLCIDGGDMASPIGFEPFPNGGRINMGAYGGTEQASKSYFGTAPCETIVAGDINGDCKVNLVDFAIMAWHWLEDNNP